MNTAMMPHDLNQSSDEHLLRAFVVAGSGSEAAFRTLVQKYLSLVLGIAMRRTGNRALGEEIAQNVFLALARKAKRLKPGASLAGWLHRATVFECAGAMRTESSLKAKMNAVSEHLLSDAAGRDVWREALPVLDEGIDALARSDREIIVLRFFERKSFREIGAALGKSDDAAQKQTERALQKLSGFLKKKGVAVSAGALATGLAALSTPAASAALAHSIAHGAVSAASSFSAKLLILKALKTMTYTKTQAAAVVTALLAIPLALQWAENQRLHTALDQSRSQQATRANDPFIASTWTGGTLSQPASTSTDPGTAASTPADPGKVTQEWELALFNPDPVQRSLRISQLLGSLSAKDAPAVIQAFNHADSSGLKFDDERRLFLRAWGRLDGAASVGYVVDHWGQSDSPELLASLAGWASTDPRRAREWTDAIPAESREKLVYGLLDGWSLVDFQGAAAYAAARPGSEARDRFCELLTQRSLRAGGIPAAQDWVYRIGDDEASSTYKRHAFDSVIQAMLLRDPASAAQWISQLHDQPFAAGKSVAFTAAKLAETSPTDALQWLASVGTADGGRTGRSAGDVFNNWANNDVVAAGTWLGQNTNHPYYDAMAASYVHLVRQTDPTAATAWANTIRNDQVRQQALNPEQLTLAQTITTDVNWLLTKNGRTATYYDGFTGFRTVNGYGSSGSGSSGVKGDINLEFDDDGALDQQVVEILSQEGAGAAETEVKARLTQKAKNPHGRGTQWQNCTSCHAN